MGERSILRDLILFGLLLAVVVELFFLLRQNERVEQRLINLEKTNSGIEQGLKNLENLNSRIEQRLSTMSIAGPSTAQNGTQTKPPDFSQGAVPADRLAAEKQYIDPKAEPGGTLYRAFPSDPGTLNPLTESDATVTDVHQFVSEGLVSRDFKDPDKIIPELANRWEMAQISWATPATGDAQSLLGKLETGLKPDVKEWLKPSVDADGRLKLEISKLGDAYLKTVLPLLGGEAALKPVQWVHTEVQPDAGSDNLPEKSKVQERFKTWLAGKPELKLGGGEQLWGTEQGFVFRLPGSKDAAAKIVAEFLAQKEQQGPKGPVWGVGEVESHLFEDKLFFTFHLRNGIRWHDGTPLTVKDYLFSFSALKDPGVDCQSIRNYYQDCEGLDSPADGVLRFTWRKLFEGAFRFSAALPLLPEHIYKYQTANQLNTHPMNDRAFGTGPYKLKEWKKKEHIILERNEDYWGVKPNFKTLYFRITSETAVRLQMLKDKKLDACYLTPPQWINDVPKPPFNQPGGLLAKKQYGTYYSYLGWNARLPLLADKRVRLALTHSINREGILKDLLYNLGVVVSGTFYSQGPFNNPNIKPWPYDPARAKALFAEAGWKDTDGDGFLDKDGKRFDLKFLFPSGSETGKKIMIAVQSDLQKAGINCELDPIEWAVYLTRVKKREFTAMMLGWSLGWDPDPYQIWHSSQTEKQGSNHCYFKNAEADQIIESLRRTFDLEERKKLCWRFHEILHDEQPYTFMFNNMELVGHNAHLYNFDLPLNPGEERKLYWPVAQNDLIWSKFWYTPKQFQRE